MSDIAIRVEGLSKQYRIGAKQAKYKTLSESLTQFVSSPVQRLRGINSRPTKEAFWALSDVGFEVKRGEVVGIIGRNGAGKSTLLKILSSITEPTTGYVDIWGRVGSLLEVGTGFHPELTGRENIYLNGAILGMHRSEIERKFDEIVAFAEVEQFIDTPVKRYSSGMGLRLGFSVAAHLEPEILIVDEVLAVGDVAFQKKCLSKMGDVATEGRTVLFVSHNMVAVQNLCTRALLLEHGCLTFSGTPVNVVNYYVDNSASDTELVNVNIADDSITLKRIYAEQSGRNELFDAQTAIKIHMEYEIKQPVSNLLLGFDVIENNGVALFRTYDLHAMKPEGLQPGVYTSTLEIPGGVLKEGSYYFEVLIARHRLRWITRNTVRLRITIGAYKNSDIDYPGLIQPIGQWSQSPIVLSEEPIRK